MKTTRWIAAALCLLLLTGLFTGCDRTEPAGQQDKLQVVATTFPLYDWTRQVAGDHAEVTLLLDSGVDLHSYQPTTGDIVKIAGCDVFLYVGGESDEWVEDALKEATNPHLIALSCMEALGDAVREEEVVEGMEADHDHEDEDDHDHEDEVEYDEHVWLSLKNAQLLCGSIADTLGRADADHAADYAENAAAYTEKLQALDQRYKAAVDAAPVKTLLFGDRFPFRYLTEDYGLTYYAAFVGCSAETEASFKTIAFLANKVDELGLHAILQLESADGGIARTIRDATAAKDQAILTLDSLQSTTSQDAAAGTTYLSVMEHNLSVLTEALK